ncbi:MAG: hypothetical protein OES38_12975 [Gammaproteobacteria bacterium]|nr:hypothetical protein [Gammaproteobacteria bacterium]
MERINQWTGLIANIGLIAGIVFLAYEIQINTNAVTTASANSYVEHWIDTGLAIGLDPEVTELMRKIDVEGWEAVSPSDANRIRFISGSILKGIEFAHFQWREGNLDPGLWQGNNAGLYEYLWGVSSMREIWLSGDRVRFHPEFRYFVDQMIADICSRRECREMAYQPPPARTKGLEAWLARTW